MDIKIKTLGVYMDKEMGIDQHKNVYDRHIHTTAWNEIYENRHVPKTKKSFN